MLTFLRPTLVRRVIMALLLAFFMAGMLLLTVIYIDASDPAVEDKGIADLGRGLVAIDPEQLAR